MARAGYTFGLFAYPQFPTETACNYSLNTMYPSSAGIMTMKYDVIGRIFAFLYLPFVTSAQCFRQKYISTNLLRNNADWNCKKISGNRSVSC